MKQKGNIEDLIGTGLCILAMVTVMMTFIHFVDLIHQKESVVQMSRRYILDMETVGYLTDASRTKLVDELEHLGVDEIDLTGTTVYPASFGESIVLQMRGKLNGQYEFVEKRVSTAKN